MNESYWMLTRGTFAENNFAHAMLIVVVKLWELGYWPSALFASGCCVPVARMIPVPWMKCKHSHEVAQGKEEVGFGRTAGTSRRGVSVYGKCWHEEYNS